MKRVILGAIIAAIIAFALQAAAWMGNFHTAYTYYIKNQDTVVKFLQDNLQKDGSYILPNVDPNLPQDQKEKLMKQYMDKPWAMVFYHSKMNDSMTSSMIFGFIHNLLTAFFIALVLYKGDFKTFWGRFFVSISFFLVVIMIGVYENVLWFEMPHQFISPQLWDIVIDWGIASIWLAFFVKKPTS